MSTHDTPTTPPVPATDDDAVERLAGAVARVTPCACSAQRARAEAAEVEVERLRRLVRLSGHGFEAAHNVRERIAAERDEARQQVADLRGLLGRVLTEVTAPGNAGLRTAIRAALAGDTTEAGAECWDCGRSDGGCDRVVEPTPDAREDRERPECGDSMCRCGVDWTAEVQSEPGRVSAEQVEAFARKHLLSGDSGPWSPRFRRQVFSFVAALGITVTDATAGGEAS